MRELKQKAIDMLKAQVPQQQDMLIYLDQRLLDYYNGLCEHSSIDDDDPEDWHNLYELLSALKLLRLLRTYPVNTEKVQQVIRLREGEWYQDNGIWKHRRGGLLQPGPRGDTYYRWMPFQVFVLTAMYGPVAWIDTEVPNGSRELLPTERDGDRGTIEDLRRLCTDFTFFAPRKTDKTGLSAYNNFLFFMLEDDDSEIYCCANSQTQSKLLYDRTQSLIRQMDVQGRRIRFTSTTTNWKPGQIRRAQLWALSAGGKAKDGLFGQLCCADEFGSAGYVNGKSDMGALVNVVLSSMGPRREPMMFTSTTAGTIQHGPFIDKLNSMKRELLHELEPHPDDGRIQSLQSPNDRWMILPLMPDEWQMDDETLLTSKSVRKKVNPALGVIVQNSFYEQSISDSRMDPLKKIETLTKLFNVYQNSSVAEWIKAEQVRPLQREMRIDDCLAKDGWVVFVGLDFSQGDDLHDASWLAARKHPSGRGTEFFADCDAWIKESTLQKSSIRPLYERWIAEGWLHVSEGEIFQPALFINRLDELIKKGVQFMYWGYDKYQSKDPINTLKAYLQSAWNVANPDPYIQVVSQLNSEFNAPTDDLYAAMFAPVPFISFSMSPLWPWCFQNCVLEIDGRDNKRPVKRSQSDSCKVDPVQALIMALDLYTRYEGTLHQV